MDRSDYKLRDFAEDLVDELACFYATKGDSVYTGAVELSPEDCKRVLFDIIADIEAQNMRFLLMAS